MQTLNDALYALYMGREITVDEALRVTNSQDEFNRMIGREVEGDTGKPAPGSRLNNGGLAAKR
jgi:Tfp pilus assembly ATPase PilU